MLYEFLEVLHGGKVVLTRGLWHAPDTSVGAEHTSPSPGNQAGTTVRH